MLLVIVLSAPALASAANPTKTLYEVKNIGDFNQPAVLPMPPQGSWAYGMNNAGNVTGWSYYFLTDPSVYALLYINKTGELIKLGALGGWDSYGYAVNDGDSVVGTYSAGAGFSGYHPFVWRAGVMRDLLAGIPACTVNVFSCGGTALDINFNGDIVGGRFISGSTDSGAFLYSRGTFTTLVAEPSSTATAINDRGVVAGTSSNGAFVYSGGMRRDLGTLGGLSSSANDISDNGKVVGASDTQNGERHAFLWTDDGMRDLGTLGGNFSEATAVNRTGTIVVGNSTTSDGDLHGFVYKGGKMVDLNGLIDPAVGTVFDVQDINDSGQIAGRVAFVTSNPVAPIKRNGALLTPGG